MPAVISEDRDPKFNIREQGVFTTNKSKQDPKMTARYTKPDDRNKKKRNTQSKEIDNIQN